MAQARPELVPILAGTVDHTFNSNMREGKPEKSIQGHSPAVCTLTSVWEETRSIKTFMNKFKYRNETSRWDAWVSCLSLKCQKISKCEKNQYLKQSILILLSLRPKKN